MDEVTQWCIEEASLITYDALLSAAQQEEKPERKPGEITDPATLEAMAAAKAALQEQTGIQVS